MNHAAVEARGFLTGCGVFFDSRNRKPSAGKLPRNRATHDAAGAYDAGVEHRSGKSVKIPSAPRLRNFEISAASFTVQTFTCSFASRAASMSVPLTTSLRGWIAAAWRFLAAEIRFSSFELSRA